MDGQSVSQSSESHLSHQIIAYLQSINPKVKLQFTAIPNVPLSYYVREMAGSAGSPLIGCAVADRTPLVNPSQSVFFDAHVDKDADLVFVSGAPAMRRRTLFSLGAAHVLSFLPRAD